MWCFGSGKITWDIFLSRNREEEQERGEELDFGGL